MNIWVLTGFFLIEVNAITFRYVKVVTERLRFYKTHNHPPTLRFFSVHADTLPLSAGSPKRRGIEILLYLRREPRLVRIPVIVITSDDQPETRRKVMGGGATDMIIKPATIDSLESALKKAKLLA